MDQLERRLLSKVARASQDFGLIEPDDRIMVAMSGGKDSYVMLHLLQGILKRAPFSFELIAVHLDQGQPGFPVHILENWLAEQDVEHKIVRRHTYEIVVEKTAPGKAYCSMCSRLRRGILYNAAVELGCTKIALGHHRDDSIETLMLNLLYAGQIKAMPPLLHSDDGRNTVIRPLIYCAEKDIVTLSSSIGFPILPCTLCSTQPDLKRAQIKRLLDDLNDDNPHVRGNMFAALSNVRPTHLLDQQLRELYGDARMSGVDDSLAAIEGGCGTPVVPAPS
jgi:tRNA 2-thiocytidine biosynthesis protein TtcA